MQATFDKTNTDAGRGHRVAEAGKAPRRPAAWRPEPSPLSREELRRLVLKTIG